MSGQFVPGRRSEHRQQLLHRIASRHGDDSAASDDAGSSTRVGGQGGECAIWTPGDGPSGACREPACADGLVRGKLPRIICPVLALVLAGCAGSPSDSFRRTSSSDSSWNVGATHPRYDTLSPCDKDSSVERAVVSNDLPASQLGIRLVPGATEKDAVRVAECLAKTLTGGEIWISSPR